MRILELGQNTPDWLFWRQAGLGASDAPVIMGVSPYKTPEELWNLKKGFIEREKSNARQQRGHDLEPVAISLYHRMRGVKTRPVCVIHEKYDWLRASLDGLSSDNQRILEVKCIKKEYHQMALGGKVPEIYIPQVQHQLLTTGLKDLDFWCYSESSWFKSHERVALVTVAPDVEYQQELFNREKEFWESLQSESGLLSPV